jgi:membrane protease YdiL (CAAX protease family)
VRTSTARPAQVTTPLAIALGLVALAGRVWSPWALPVTVAVGVVGLLAPLPGFQAPGRVPRSAPATWLFAVGIGVAALFISSRLPAMLGLGPAGAGRVARQIWPSAVAASVVAAVAEEAFFRRLVYGWLASWGAAAAVLGSAVAFAANP